MRKIKGRAKYIGLTMPEGLMLEVAAVVDKNDSYRSKNEFVKFAIKEKLDSDAGDSIRTELKEIKELIKNIIDKE